MSCLRGESGSTLLIAVVGWLVVTVLGLSVALLAGLETRMALSGKHAAQAEALADAALARAADELGPAAGAATGFSGWLGRELWGGAQTPAPHGDAPGAYWYRARVDNDCGALDTVPDGAEEVRKDGRPCDRADDTNGRAVVTGWAEAAAARARVRAIVAVDEPWHHACAIHRATPDTACGVAAAGSLAPSISPADPDDPAGPSAWADLPRPYLGCSRIDPTLHRGGNAPAIQQTLCGDAPPSPARQAMFAPPYPAHLAPGEPRFVIMGSDPSVTAGAPVCNGDPGGSGTAYFGYFDCALSSYCDPAEGHVCPGGRLRKGCVAARDSRGGPGDPHYVRVGRDAGGGITAGCESLGHTGMVFLAGLPDGDIGSPASPLTVYVVRGSTVSLQGRTVHGTMVIEGGSGGAPGCDDLRLGAGLQLATGRAQYGFPLAMLLYDPGQPPPAGNGVPQRLCAALGPPPGSAAASRIRGLVYSAGRIELGLATVSGGTVAWAIDALVPGGTLARDSTFGDTGPVPGFPGRAPARVRLLRKSYIECSAPGLLERAGPTACQ